MVELGSSLVLLLEEDTSSSLLIAIMTFIFNVCSVRYSRLEITDPRRDKILGQDNVVVQSILNV